MDFNLIVNNAPSVEPDRQFYFIEQCKKLISEKSEEIGRPLTYFTQTFGCQMNFKDSEKLNGVLEAMGYVAADSEKADFVVYNTCTVRENANTRVYGRIGYLGRLKKNNPEMKIAMCGCMMQEPHVIEKIRKSYRFVDIVFGTFNIYKLAELIFNSFSGVKQVIDIWQESGPIVEDLPSDLKYSFKAGVNIMYGCNNFCSYCIVPYVRGRERSRKPEDIINECRTLVSRGVKEIMLLGQNVNSYGKNLGDPVSFPELLKMVEQVEGLQRIRFMTSHPKDLSDELIEVMRNSQKICTHMHLPVQSGSSRLLKLMNRHYTKESYLELVEKLKAAIPGIAITTDIIVGFPGETEEDFEDTLDICRKVRYSSAYTFIYSKRTGTPAASMEDQVPEEVVSERFNRLLKVIGDISAEEAMKDRGKVVQVLVEEVNGQDDMLVTGRMSNNLLVHFPASHDLIGQLVDVKLNECKGFYYIGELA